MPKVLRKHSYFCLLSSYDTFLFPSSMTSISQFIMDTMPKKTQYDTFFYLTLLNRLVVGGLQSARLHLDMERILFRACQRHPQGVQLIGKLGPDTVARIVDGFSDADRIQVRFNFIFIWQARIFLAPKSSKFQNICM